jgi:hypothetical protein
VGGGNECNRGAHFLHDASPAYTPEEMDRYIEAWSQPGAASAMINYYRSSVRTSPKRAEAQLRPIKAPTLIIWGQGDRYLAKNWRSPSTRTYPTSIASNACPTPRTGYITTRLSASTNCSSIFSLPPCQPRTAETRRSGNGAEGLQRRRHGVRVGQLRGHCDHLAGCSAVGFAVPKPHRAGQVLHVDHGAADPQ